MDLPNQVTLSAQYPDPPRQISPYQYTPDWHESDVFSGLRPFSPPCGQSDRFLSRSPSARHCCRLNIPLRTRARRRDHGNCDCKTSHS